MRIDRHERQNDWPKATEESTSNTAWTSKLWRQKCWTCTCIEFALSTCVDSPLLEKQSFWAQISRLTVSHSSYKPWSPEELEIFSWNDDTNSYTEWPHSKIQEIPRSNNLAIFDSFLLQIEWSLLLSTLDQNLRDWKKIHHRKKHYKEMFTALWEQYSMTNHSLKAFVH